MDVTEKFKAASDRLDAARRACANAESELIRAQQQYNDASREYVHERFDQPDDHRKRFDKLLASAVSK